MNVQAVSCYRSGTRSELNNEHSFGQVAVRAFWGRQRKRLGLDKLVEEHQRGVDGLPPMDDAEAEMGASMAPHMGASMAPQTVRVVCTVCTTCDQTGV